MTMRVVRTLVFAAVVAGAVLVFIPSRILASSARPAVFTVGWNLAGLVLIAVGVFVLSLCYAGFIVEGQGTPAPYDPPRRLVTGHLYKRVRNPIYVGVALILLGEATVFQSVALLGYAAVVWLGFHGFVVFYEEPTLRARFGSAYEEYLRQVPRWLPRLGRRSFAGPTG